MPIPSEYQRAELEFARFVTDAKEASGLATTHQVYTMTPGVLQTFRRRLVVGDAIRFGGVLPPILRAIFVADWDTNEPLRPFGDRALMTEEVQSLRADHNLAPDSAIRDVAIALRKNIDVAVFQQMLETLPEGAEEYWRI